MRSPQRGERSSWERRIPVTFCCRSERSATTFRLKRLTPFSEEVRERPPDAGIAMDWPAMSIEFVTWGRVKVTPSPAAGKRMLISLPSASCWFWKPASPLSRAAAEAAACSASGLGVWRI